MLSEVDQCDEEIRQTRVAVVESVKSIIKDKHIDAKTRFYALLVTNSSQSISIKSGIGRKQLVKEAMLLKNGNFAKLVDSKLLDKLTSIAGHEKSDKSLERGKSCLKQFNKNLGKWIFFD